MQELLTNLLNLVGLAWWVEVKTETPRCIYYFGPFLTATTAASAQAGYVADLEQEGAQEISVAVKRCKPSRLTVSEESGDSNQQVPGAFSSQLQ